MTALSYQSCTDESNHGCLIFVTGQEVLFSGKFSFLGETNDWMQFLRGHLLVDKCLDSQLIAEIAKDNPDIRNCKAFVTLEIPHIACDKLSQPTSVLKVTPIHTNHGMDGDDQLNELS